MVKRFPYSDENKGQTKFAESRRHVSRDWFYSDRTVGGHRHHRDPGRDAPSSAVFRQIKIQADRVRQQLETGRAGNADLFRG